jgi:hypothetical protein
MTTEACCAKLAYLWGRVPGMAEVEKYMSVSIRGEMAGAGDTKHKTYFDRGISMPRL